MELSKNVHLSVLNKVPASPANKLSLVKGEYDYYHYNCDTFNDQGWGCAYRSLQTICSWIKAKTSNNQSVPTIREIQKILINLEDKPKSFLNSHQWIGALEVSYVIDTLYNVPSKILHIPQGKNLHSHLQTLYNYFETYACVAMMGGDVDAASKGICGVCLDENDVNEGYLLVVDPHYVGKELSTEELAQREYVSWVSVKDFEQNSFYNFCLPQIKWNET